VTDLVNTVPMFVDYVAEDTPPAKRSHMTRVDVRLPSQVVDLIERRCLALGLSTSEYIRSIIIDGLERRGLT